MQVSVLHLANPYSLPLVPPPPPFTQPSSQDLTVSFQLSLSMSDRPGWPPATVDDTSQSFISPMLLEPLEASAVGVRRSSSEALHSSFPLPPSCIPTASTVIPLFLAPRTPSTSSTVCFPQLHPHHHHHLLPMGPSCRRSPRRNHFLKLLDCGAG